MVARQKAIRKAHSGELKTIIVVLMGLISNGKNVVVEKMSKMLKAPYYQQVFNWLTVVNAGLNLKCFDSNYTFHILKPSCLSEE